MGAITLLKAGDREFKKVPVATGALNVARIVEDPLSHDIGAGVVEFEDISIPWTLNYNEVFYVLEGELRFRTLEGWWTDAGTFESLHSASKLVADGGANKLD